MRSSGFHLNPLSWPIWVKLLAGFGIILIVLAVPVGLLIRTSIIELGTQSARTFVAQNGAQQVNAITNALEVGRFNLEGFINDAANQRMLMGRLLGNVRTGIELNYPDAERSEVEALFVRTLLNPATSLFENVRLLNRDGQVMARASLATSEDGASAGNDESGSPAYQAAVAAQLQNDTTLLNLDFTETPVIEYVRLLRWRDNTVLGYLVARVNNTRAIDTNVQFTSDTYQAHTYLANARGTTIDVGGDNDAPVVMNEEIVAQALSGQSGVAAYTSGSNTADGEELIGFYAPVRGTPLALVTQVSHAEAIAEAQQFFSLRVFVIGVGAVGLLTVIVLLINQMIAPPLARLRRATLQFSEGNFDVAVFDTGRGDEIGDLANAFAIMREAVRDLIEELEARIAARTRDIGATQEISRFAATQRDLQVLMERVVDLILDRFNSIYHAQIFLIDADREYAIVRASTGEIGRQLIARGHRLAVGSVSVIGQVTEQGRYILARDTTASQVHRRNEFLPETRAELAIPLRVGDDIIGALDVQSKQPDVFTDDLINVLQTMADQIAIAIQNARLYQESMRRVAEIEASNRQSTLRAWQEYMRDQRLTQLSVDAGVPIHSDISDLRRTALEQGRLAVGALTERQTIPIALPIQLRGQTLGAVEWELPANGFSDDKLELAQALANRLALSLDNARLFQESRRATERERLVNTIAAKLTAQTNIDNILQTAVREVGQALRAPQVTIRLHPAEANGNGTDKPHTNGNSEV